MWNSPLQIFSYSCQRFEGLGTPACGWFQSSDWAGRTRQPQSRRTKRALTWPGTREPEERTGLRGVGWKHIKVLGGGADAAAQSSNIKREGFDPHVASAHRAAMYQRQWKWPLFSCMWVQLHDLHRDSSLDESHWSDHRVMMWGRALINSPPISE